MAQSLYGRRPFLAPDLGTPEGDGLPNLAEYALLLSPTLPSQPPTVERFTYAEGDRLQMIVQRDPAHNDIAISARIVNISTATQRWLRVKVTH